MDIKEELAIEDALVCLNKLLEMLEAIGEEGRMELFRQLAEKMGFDMSNCKKPNVGEFYYLALVSIRNRLSEQSLPSK